MNNAQHKAAAERLLEKGQEAVEKIAVAHAARTRLAQEYGATVTPSQNGALEGLTHLMDEQGKKAMGIWAQAQVHATLATVIE